jgi:hypothetical protein
MSAGRELVRVAIENLEETKNPDAVIAKHPV